MQTRFIKSSPIAPITKSQNEIAKTANEMIETFI